jgi:hypothetical protein
MKQRQDRLAHSIIRLRAGIGSLHATSGAHPTNSSLYSIFFSGRKTVLE